jgi:GGDEF domain-containing protein
LRACVRLQDTVARIGGDEFAILLEDTADARGVADRIVASMREPVTLAGRLLATSISVGLARHTTPERRPERDVSVSVPGFAEPSASSIAAAANREATAALLLRHADTAMYAAKGAGKGRAVLCDVGAGQPAGEPLLTPGTGRASGT